MEEPTNPSKAFLLAWMFLYFLFDMFLFAILSVKKSAKLSIKHRNACRSFFEILRATSPTIKKVCAAIRSPMTRVHLLSDLQQAWDKRWKSPKLDCDVRATSSKDASNIFCVRSLQSLLNCSKRSFDWSQKSHHKRVVWKAPKNLWTMAKRCGDFVDALSPHLWRMWSLSSMACLLEF